MFLKLDENNYIQGYAVIGSFDEAIEVDLEEADIPFPYYQAYQYIDGQIVLDEDKLNELIEAENNKPLSEIDELKQRISDLESMLQSIKTVADALTFDAGVVDSEQST